MLRFNFFNIPIRVQLLFWLSAFFIAGGLQMRDTPDWGFILLKMGIVFLSIFVHELGHASASIYWGGRPQVELHALGGVTLLGHNAFTRWQHLGITCAGPLASVFLAAICFFIYPYSELAFRGVLSFAIWINVIWTLFNLLPILPMDGGQILRGLLGPERMRWSCVIGMIAAILLAVWAALIGFYFMAAILGYFAYMNYKGYGQEIG